MIVRHYAPVKLLLGIPVCLAAVFILDVIGPFGPVVGVLYLPLIVMSTRAVSNVGVAYVGIACVVMSFASFILSGVEGFGLLRIWQLGLLLSAIFLTTLISLLVIAPNSKDNGIPD